MTAAETGKENIGDAEEKSHKWAKLLNWARGRRSLVSQHRQGGRSAVVHELAYPSHHP